jgi:hypothetical protein
MCAADAHKMAGCSAAALLPAERVHLLNPGAHLPGKLPHLARDTTVSKVDTPEADVRTVLDLRVVLR